MEVRDLRIQETTADNLPSVPTANTLFSIASLISSSRSSFPSRNHQSQMRQNLDFPFPQIDMRSYYESLQRNLVLSGGLTAFSVDSPITATPAGDRVLDLSTHSSVHILPDLERSSEDEVLSRGEFLTIISGRVNKLIISHAPMETALSASSLYRKCRDICK